MPPLAALLVDDPNRTLERAFHTLQALGARTTRTITLGEACTLLRSHAYDVILTVAQPSDPHSSEPSDGLDAIVRLSHLTPVVLFGTTTTDVSEQGVALAIDPASSSADLIAAINGFVDPTKTSSSTAIAVRRYFTCLERSTWDELRDLCAENVRYLSPQDDSGARLVVEGRDRFVQFAADTFRSFSGSRFVVDSLRDVPGGAIVRYTTTWLDHDQRRILSSGSMFVRFDGELIEELDIRLDLRELASVVPDFHS